MRRREERECKGKNEERDLAGWQYACLMMMEGVGYIGSWAWAVLIEPQ